jgi:5'(3')-deoxyribonucleotidase
MSNFILDRKKYIVLVDLDDTIYPFIPKILERYNEKYSDNLTISDITNYRIKKFIKPECENIFKEFANKKLFNDITLTSDVKDTLSILNEKYNIFFTTAGHPKTTKHRDKLLSRNLPWYSTGQLISIKYKDLIWSDFLIDDCLDNFTEYSMYKGILKSQPWNINNLPPNEIRINDFSDVLKVFEEEEYMRKCEIYDYKNIWED